MLKFNIINKKEKIYNIKTNNIFVLAGGQINNGDVNSWVKQRLDIAIKIKKENINSIIYCIGGGTYHKPPILNNYNYVIHESKSCSNYLIENDISTNKIKREWSSYDTIGNGFFSFINFIIPLKIEELVLITSEFHMERAKEIFNYFNILFNQNIKITYICCENYMDSEFLIIRKKREKKSLESFKENIVNKIKSVEDFFEWFYTKHNAYNNIMKREIIKENEVKSY